MRLSAAAIAAGLVAGLSVWAPAPATGAAGIDQDVPCAELESSSTEDTYRTDAVSLPTQLLGIEAAQAEASRLAGGREPGAGVNVAVIDSGVDRGNPRLDPLIDVADGVDFGTTRELLDHHGTAVAGLIAGKPRDGLVTGVAPGARIVDVRVYDDDDPSGSEEASPVEIGRLVAGVKWVADNARRLEIGVATIAVRIGESDELERQVRRLQRQDVVVVAASGNRPTEDDDPLLDDYGVLAPGEDAARDIHPASYDGVIAVNATLGGSPDEVGGDVRDWVLQSSATDVAAPTWGAVTLGLNGSTCLLEEVRTSWSAALVSGVVALLRSAYPEDTAEQVVARLVGTASGSPDDRHVLVGAGVVQPVEALTRPLTPSRDGDLDRLPDDASTIPAARAPEPDADLLADARRNAVWFGLLGGGTVVLALLLRPVLARRRS